MIFNSIVFLIFLPFVFGGYWLISNPKRGGSVSRIFLQNLFIVIASYVFYGWWNWSLLFLISLTSVWAWSSGLLVGSFKQKGNHYQVLAKVVVALAFIVNLGILGYFKYCNFFLENLSGLLKCMGVSLSFNSLQIILPVGISFYTFQALSYVIDVYRGDIRPTKDLMAFLAFVSFFPQLVAGPIERATNLLPQFLSPRSFDYRLAVEGCRQMLWGFFKKMVVADGCAYVANSLFNPVDTNSSVSLLLALFCFTIQIYGDFSGYSDIAIGVSKLFGVRLKRNFAFPYFSRTIAEFWRRWHISLTTWFKDYLYIPLGGSRDGKLKTIRNTFVVFVVSGLWHGASWTFLTWGLVHALAFMPSLIKGKNRMFVGNSIAAERFLPSFTEIFLVTRTFVTVMIAWAFFRAETISQAFNWLKRIFCDFDLSLQPLAHKGVPRVVAWAFVMLICEWFNRNEEFGFARYPKNIFLRFMLYLILIFVIVLNISPTQTFIYFQF